MSKPCEKCGKLFYPDRVTRRFCSRPCAADINGRAGAAATNYGPNAKFNKVRKRAVFARDYRSDYECRT